jgi:hypothetical protein
MIGLHCGLPLDAPGAAGASEATSTVAVRSPEAGFFEEERGMNE